MSEPKLECEALMNEAIPFAEKMLLKHSDFYPYAYVLRPSGEIVGVAGYNGTDKPISQEIIDILRESLIQDAVEGKVKATAIVYDVRITSDGGQQSDAIAVALDHRDNFSCVMIFPYSIRAGKLEIGKPSRQNNPTPIFPQIAISSERNSEH